METLIGIRGGDFVLLAGDAYAQFSICRMKNDEDKLVEIDSNKVLAGIGPVGDRTQFCEYMRKNIHLKRLMNGRPMDVAASASFIRDNMAYYIRHNPRRVDVLYGGYDHNGPALYWMDYLSSMVRVDKAAHGYGAYFVYSILDKYYHENMTQEEGINLLKKCIEELKIRFIIPQSHFFVKIVNQKGIQLLQL